jgi:hypothetical protein
MKKLVMFFLLLLQIAALPQNNFIRQITAGDFDAKNPFIYKDEFLFYPSIFFELHKNGYSNIYSINYNSVDNNFEDTVALTSGTYQNLSPTFEKSSGLLFQSNQNGNWDIVLIPETNDVWSEPKFLTNSTADEIDPKYFESIGSYYNRDSTNILFKRGNDIVFLSYKQNQITENVIFQNTADLSYSEIVGLETKEWEVSAGHYVFAIEENNSHQKKIVKRFKPFNGAWQQKTIIKDNCDCSDLSVQVYNYNYLGLVYQDTLNGQRRFYVIENPTTNSTVFELPIGREGNLASFDSYSLLIIGKELNKTTNEPDLYVPYTFLVRQNGTTKVRYDISDLGFWLMDSVAQVSVQNPNLTIGSVGIDLGGLVVYTVWEDSADGRIHLFGTPQHLSYGAVEDETYANDFALYQNYPNPFNPSTTIKYALNNRQFVTIKVFDILGNEIATLVNEEKPAGRYELNFNAANLASGVYVYSILTDENRLSRKMMLMK